MKSVVSDLSGAYYPKNKNIPNSFFFSCKESRMESPRSFYGCFYVGPFHSSQALTVANALRRTLLSEISGIAITSIEIDGVTHEYSTLPGMKESVLDLLLNLKEIVFKTYGSLTNPQLGYLQAKGPGVIRALDLKMPSFIQCVDPNQYIATLTEDGFLNFKFQLEEGKNTHKTVDFTQSFPLTPISLKEKSNQQKNQDVGLFFEQQKYSSENSEILFWKSVPLKMDAIFNPIQQVNYGVRPYGPLYASTRKQILVLEVWTNGSILPRQAVYEGFRSLMVLFSQLEKMKIFHSILLNSALSSQRHYNTLLQKVEQTYNSEKPVFENVFSDLPQTNEQKSNLFFSNVSLTPKATPLFYDKQKKSSLYNDGILSSLKKEDKKNKLIELAKQNISSLSVSKRCKTLLQKVNISTVGDLLKYSQKDLLKRPGFGKKSINEIQEILKKYEIPWS